MITQTTIKRTQGMNWIRQEKRLAIYLRDGMACVYCGSSVEDGAKLTLDHLQAYSNGGSNETTNLVTCCHRCNSARGNRSWRSFAGKVAEYLNHGISKEEIVRHITNCRNRKIDVNAAKQMMEQRGSCFSALQAK